MLVCAVPHPGCWRHGACAGIAVLLCKTEPASTSTCAGHKRTANTFLHRRKESSGFPSLFHPETRASPSRSLQGATCKPLLGSVSSTFRCPQHRQAHPNQPSFASSLPGVRSSSPRPWHTHAPQALGLWGHIHFSPTCGRRAGTSGTTSLSCRGSSVPPSAPALLRPQRWRLPRGGGSAALRSAAGRGQARPAAAPPPSRGRSPTDCPGRAASGSERASTASFGISAKTELQ